MSTRPAMFDDVVEERAFHLCTKGGSVVRHALWSALWFECEGCHQQWKSAALVRFTDQDIADRFYVKFRPLTDNHAIVWVTDPVTGWMHTASVPAVRAGDSDRVKV